MRIKKSALTLALALAVVFGIMIGANAADTVKTITATLNYGITVKYNGETQELKDANGNRVYPISYEGTTYLPIRAVAGLLGLEVIWDGPTQTVWLGAGYVPTPQASDTSSTSTGNETPSWVTLDYSKYPAGAVFTVGGEAYTSLGSFSYNFVVCTNSYGERVLVNPKTGTEMPCVADQDVDLGDGGQRWIGEEGALTHTEEGSEGFNG